jgi:hypothetical protein
MIGQEHSRSFFSNFDCKNHMPPSTTKSQQHLFGAAVAAKRGKKTFPAAEKLAAQMSESKLKDFTKLKKKK